ncbi:MAG: DUF4317 domain-containing protein [Clostridia bacterium]|nr:DUF4317 domain-containing protein [Clostridia bacterium]
MNPRDFAEIRRRLNPDRRNPSVIRGCYIAHDGQVISTFAHPVYGMAQEELEKYMAIFKKVLSGTAGQNLLPVEFTAKQTMEGDEHKLLMDLRGSALKDDMAVNELYEKAVQYVQAVKEQEVQSVDAAQLASNYLVLLMHDGYDVPYKDGNDETDADRSADVFSYIICAVCPVKPTKPALGYFAAEGEFHNKPTDWMVSMPELGFLFPSFEERSANIYTTMFYTRDSGKTHDDFVKIVFGAEPQMPASEQKETFQTVLQESLKEECSLDVMQAVHETVSTMIEERKADKHAEPLKLTRQDVKDVLESCGVSQEKTDAFDRQYTETFGAYTELPAVNMVTPKSFKVNTPSVTINVDPAHSDLIETRVIDGRRYILVLADGDVAVNGVNVTIGE